MPVYDFTFPDTAAGASVAVRDADGRVVLVGRVGVASGGNASYSAALGAGDYDASVQPTVNVPDVAGVESSGGGASGTVLLTGTASGVTNASGELDDNVPIDFDPPAANSYVEVVGGRIRAKIDGIWAAPLPTLRRSPGAPAP